MSTSPHTNKWGSNNTNRVPDPLVSMSTVAHADAGTSYGPEGPRSSVCCLNVPSFVNPLQPHIGGSERGELA